MSRQIRLATFAALTVIMLTISVGRANSEGWRLPFSGEHFISNGPQEGLHVQTGNNDSSEAIDYAPAGQVSFPVLAPYDGTVLDVLNVADFGWVVRTNHPTDATSFFAHLDGNSILVQTGDDVNQGQQIAMSGNSGTGGGGNHLHFEGRVNAAAGNVYSGQAVPIREIPGTWWNPWYSPPPNFQNDPDRFSGGAQYPEGVDQPTTMLSEDGRHLANVESPPGIAAAHTSDIMDTQATIHMGASPSTPSDPDYETRFQVDEYLESCACWQAPYGSYTPNPTWTQTEDSNNRCDPNDQHCHRVWSRNDLHGWAGFRYVELWTGDSAQGIPHIVAAYDPGDATTILEYEMSGADQYQVFEYHGNSPDLTYDGPASMIQVDRVLGGQNLYIVRAHYPDGTWSPWSIWLVVHW